MLDAQVVFSATLAGAFVTESLALIVPLCLPWTLVGNLESSLIAVVMTLVDPWRGTGGVDVDAWGPCLMLYSRLVVRSSPYEYSQDTTQVHLPSSDRVPLRVQGWALLPSNLGVGAYSCGRFISAYCAGLARHKVQL